MTAADRAQRGRSSFERRSWGDAFAHLTAAASEGPLSAEDLERIAVAAYMMGRDADCEAAWLRAHREWQRRGERERAARCAVWQALALFFRGDLAPAMGWVARGARLVDDRDDCAEQAWLRMLAALPRMFAGDVIDTYPVFVEAGATAQHLGDLDAATFARLCRGDSLILQGRIDEGMVLLDEIMVAVTADEVSPMLAGVVYCQVIDLCQTVFDLRRAREWTSALSRWCDAQPDLVPFRGNCLVHRSEIFQLQGAWHDALTAAQRATEWLSGPPAWDTLGSAYYQLAEIQRLRGDFADAEESFRQASLAGREPEPGMSLLRLAQGQTDLAVPSIRRVLDEAQGPIARSRLLPACVDIMLATGDVAAARAAADELAATAAHRDAPYLHALGTHAVGAVLLAEGDARAGLAKLRGAHEMWRALDARYQAARVRMLIGRACLDLEDRAGAQLEFEGARHVFTELGAAPDLEVVAQLMRTKPAAAPLSPRERQVLILVADGKTNHAIASELFISQKTVARHLSNIFTKLRLSSRAEATAYAYRQRIVQ
jgi:DNA-binding CsgD family transcriptional regulator